MRISIVAVGTRGDVQPLITLGLGLCNAGFDVAVITHSNFRSIVETCGLEYRPIPLDMEEVLHTPEGKEWLTAGRNIWKTITQMTKLWKLHFHSMFPAIREGCQGADAILFSYLGMGACHIAEKNNIPCFGTWPTPVTVMPNAEMTIAIPGLLMKMFPTFLAGIGHYATEQMVWQTFGRAQNKWREMLGLSPIRFPGIVHYFRQRKIPFLYGFSPNLVNRPSSWPDHYRICGYWLLEKEMKWEPSNGLADFMNAGSAPFYIGFGSMVTMAPQKLGSIAIDALRLINARGILATGWTGLKAEELNKTLPDYVYAVDYVPHNWLFPKVAGLVHHGGASTTGAAIQAGKPSTVVPFFADQSFWGDKLEAKGVATKSIPFKKLSSMGLAHALNDLQSNERLHQNAKALAERVQQEDGIADAVNFIIRALKA